MTTRAIAALGLLLPTLAFAQFNTFGGSAPSATSAPGDFGARETSSLLPAGVGVTTKTSTGRVPTVQANGTETSAALSGDIGIFYSYTSSTLMGGVAGWTWPLNFVPLAGLPIGEWKIRTGPDLTSTRYAVGFGTGLLGGETVTSKGAWFRYSTQSPDAGWMACSADGTAGSCEDLSPVVPVVASTVYLLRVDCSKIPASCDFSVNGTLVKTKTTNIPTASSQVSQVVGLWNLASSAARRMDIAGGWWSVLRW